MSAAKALADRMRKHVHDRGGLSWAMMIEAADLLEKQADDLRFAHLHAVAPLICARAGALTKDGRMRLSDVKVHEKEWIRLHLFTDGGLNDHD